MKKLGHYTHGLYRASDGKQSKLHHVWTEMRRRCRNPKSKDYSGYGGRGIVVCSEWEDFARFHKWAMANGYQEGLSIERKNNDGNYCPENCTWIPIGQQRRNNRRVIKVTYQGKTQILSDWAKETGIKFCTLYARLMKGVPIETLFQKKEDVKWDRTWKETRKKRTAYPQRDQNSGQFRKPSPIP